MPAIGAIVPATDMREHQRPEAFRFALRRVTRTEHEALDGNPAFAAMMNGTLSLDGYARLMAVFHGFYERHDELLDLACRHHGLHALGFTYASRAIILRDDLASLGALGTGQHSSHDEPASLPTIRSAGTLVGVLYVLEGSMLGGSVLCRAVESLLVKTGAKGSGYWRWCRDAGAARWAMTCDVVERTAASDAARNDMIAGAQAAFHTFDRWLDRWSDDRRSVRSLARC
jgi:heme oxygenase